MFAACVQVLNGFESQNLQESCAEEFGCASLCWCRRDFNLLDFWCCLQIQALSEGIVPQKKGVVWGLHIFINLLTVDLFRNRFPKAMFHTRLASAQGTHWWHFGPKVIQGPRFWYGSGLYI